MATVTLVSNDAQRFNVDKMLLSGLKTVLDLMKDVDQNEGNLEIPLPQVNKKDLQKVLDFAKSRLETTDEAERQVWEKNFFNLAHEDLFNLILASNYLSYQDLLDASCKVVANMIKGKTPEEIRQTFNVSDDFTPEERQEILEENEWVEKPEQTEKTEQ